MGREDASRGCAPTIPGYLPALGLAFETEALFLLAPPPEPAPPSFLTGLGTAAPVPERRWSSSMGTRWRAAASPFACSTRRAASRSRSGVKPRSHFADLSEVGRSEVSQELMKQIIALLLCVVIPSVGFAATENGYKVRYDGGSIQSLKSGDDVHVLLEQKQIRLVKNKKDVAVVPASAITEVSYGQDVHRRVGAAIGIGVVTFGLGALMALREIKEALYRPDVGRRREQGWLRLPSR